jgi:mutator protein MutT
MRIIGKYLREATKKDLDKDTNKYTKAIIKNDAYLLVLRRNNEAIGGGDWDLPGGAIKEDESPEDAVKRETMEEVGIEVKNCKVYDTIKLEIPEKGIHSTMKIYKCKPEGQGTDIYLNPSSNNPDTRPEHTEYKWIKFKDELDRMPMLKQLKDCVRKCLQTRKG